MSDMKFAIDKLHGGNWQTWNVRVEMLLTRDNLWDVVQASVPGEIERTAAWQLSGLLLLLEDSQLPLVKNSVFAHDVFNALRNYHQKTTRSVRVSLLKKLCTTNLPANGNIEDHLRIFDDLFDRLEGSGTKLDKDTKVCMLLRSLPASFDGLVTALDSRSDEDISLEGVKSKLIDEYNRQLERRDGETSKTEKAMRSDENKSSHYQTEGVRTCHFCKKPGHFKQNCRKFLASKKRESSTSTVNSGSGKAKTAQSESRNIAFTAASKRKSNVWVIDSGASAHMTNDRSFYSELEEFECGFITMADGNKSQILGEGKGVVKGIDSCGEIVNINIHNVRFVPGLSTNLLSVGKLVQKSLEVTFNDSGCFILNADGVEVATGSKNGGLY